MSRPTNPTGNVLTDDEIEHLDAIAKTRNIPLIIDGAYGLPFPGILFTDARPHWNHNTILALSLSKLGLPGVRTGIIVASEEIIRAYSNANTIVNLACGNLGGLNFGLPREDEFSVVCGWLGCCDVIHKLDQKQTPEKSSERYQVPDLLAIFNVQGKQVPVLIEVKSKKDNTLSFRPDYMEKLKQYSNVLNLPILIAWRWQGIWILFELKHMKKAKKNYNIHFGDAIRENLLGILAGDFSYSLYPKAGLHIGMKKEELISTEEADDGSTDQWKMVIDDVYYTNGDGQVVRNLPSQVQQLFVISDLEKSENHTDTHITMNYVVRESSMLFAHMALVRLLNWQTPADPDIHWRTMLHGSYIVKGIENFRTAIQEAMEYKIVRTVFNLTPRTEPEFDVGR